VDRVRTLVFAAALCAGACSTSGTARPDLSTQPALTSGPSSRPTERPSPDLVDVSAAFLARIGYAQGGGTVTVQAPEQVWHHFSSKSYHYRLAYPDGWDVVSAFEGRDRFDGPGADHFSATRAELSGLSLDAFVKVEIAEYETRFHWTYDAKAAISIGGAHARIVTFHGIVDGRRVVIFEVFSLRGGYAYDLTWTSPRGHEANDLALFERILATFAFA
jgi:hypothetical protein